MEILNNKIKKFVEIKGGDGCGYGSGDGSGYGDGWGSGDGSGYGDYAEYNTGIGSLNGETIYLIDHLPTIISHVCKNVAHGFIVNADLTLEPCAIAKGHNYFAHGKSSQEAIQALEEKIISHMNTTQALVQFKKKFKKGKKYKGTEFYKWHHLLTGSCKQGRDNFIKRHQLNLEDEYSVLQFIKICEHDYGSTIIAQLKDLYNIE